MTDTANRAAERVRFPGLAPSALEHPVDRAALQTLRKTPGLDVLFKKLASLGFERQVRLLFTVDSLRLSPRQCPRIYGLLTESAQVLDAPTPELYLFQSPIPNAVAIGMDRYTIALTSGLVNLLTEDELRFVIAHELGHIKSGHMLYRTMAIFLAMIGVVAVRNLPIVDILTTALQYAFYDWSRKSELTADRAGLLVAQDPDTAVRVLLKLAGGAHPLGEELSTAEFLKQADDYDDMDDGFLNSLYKFDLMRYQTHPFPALRGREITRWGASDEYARILRGEYPRTTPAAERRCPRCAVGVENPTFRFCPECGETLPD